MVTHTDFIVSARRAPFPVRRRVDLSVSAYTPYTRRNELASVSHSNLSLSKTCSYLTPCVSHLDLAGPSDTCALFTRRNELAGVSHLNLSLSKTCSYLRPWVSHSDLGGPSLDLMSRVLNTRLHLTSRVSHLNTGGSPRALKLPPAKNRGRVVEGRGGGVKRGLNCGWSDQKTNAGFRACDFEEKVGALVRK
jgi:hypothetical protein